MGAQHEPVPASPAPSGNPAPRPQESEAGQAPDAATTPIPPSHPGGWRLPALTVLLVALIQPLSWPGGPDPLWFPSAGLGLVLVAWFGPQAALLLLIAAPLAALRACLWPTLQPADQWLKLFAQTVCEGTFQAAMLATA